MGTLARDLAVGVRIARAEVVDLYRRNDTRRQRVIYALLFLLILPGGVLFVQAAWVAGVASRDGVSFPVVAAARTLLLPGMVVFAVLGGLGAAQSIARDSVRPLLLTSASTRAVVVGKALYLLGTWLAPLAFVFLPVLAYAVGARSPLFPVALLLAGLPLLLVTLLVGLTLAYLLWLGIVRLGLPDAVRRLLVAGITLVVFVFAFAGGFLSGQVTGESIEALAESEPVTPIGWYADLLFVGSPAAEPLGPRTALAALLVAGALPLAFVAQVRVAPAFWYATPAVDGTEDDEPAREATRERRPSETIGRTRGLTGRSPVLRTARGYVVSALRRPDQYVYLFYYLFPVLAVVIPLALESPGSLGPVLGGTLVVLGVWLAGAVFCLNPLGTEGAMLSQLVLARTPANVFVHARLLSGVGLGAVLTLAGVALYAPTGPFVTPLLVLALGLALLGVVVASAGFALGLGSALPKFETTEVFDSIETLAPSVVAALVHGAFTLVLALAGVAVAAVVALPESPLSPLERTVAALAFAAVVLVVADGSRRYAVARLRDYGRDRLRVGRPLALYASLSLALAALVLAQSVGITVAFLVGFDRPVEVLLPLLFVVEYAGFALVALGFLYVTRRGLAYLDLGWPSPREVGIVVAGVLVSLGVWAVGLALVAELGLPAADHALFDAEDGDPRLLLALVPLLLLVNGPVEELLFRNVIQKYLDEAFATLPAVLLASAVFALVHVPAYLTAGLAALVVTLALLFVLSCLWGYIYVRTESLFVVAAIHGVYNATLVGGAYLWLVSG